MPIINCITPNRPEAVPALDKAQAIKVLDKA